MAFTSIVFALLAGVAALAAWPIVSPKKWNPRGKHCYVTGGSTGLGRSLAILLTKKGADVTIVARDEGRLAKALADLEAVRQTPNQVLKSLSYSLNDSDNSAAALEAACQLHGGRCPDAVFLCAGASTPGFFVEQDEASMRKGMDDGYWVQAWSALAAAKRIINTGEQGSKIIFVSSVLGYMGIVGYSSYTPAKHALRGLAESLRGELLLYNVDVSILFPGTIYTPGYERENLTKPKITLKIEENDAGTQPDDCAKALLTGVERGQFHISVDFITDIFRCSTRGSSPFNNVVVDAVLEFVGFFALAIWRQSVDSAVKGHQAEHRRYLVEKGLWGNKKKPTPVE